MRFRFTLTHSVVGSLEIQEPDGWRDAVLKLERHNDFHSLIEYFEGSFVFYGSSTEFVDAVELSYGYDALIDISIEYTQDDVIFDNVFQGQLDLSQSVRMPDNKVQIPIVRNDFWAKFINRLETPVNIQDLVSVDGDPVNQIDSVNLRMTSQKIRKSYRAIQSFGVKLGGSTFSIEPAAPCSAYPNESYNDGDYIQLDPDENEIDEITESYTFITSINPEVPVNKWFIEFGGDYEFDLYVAMSYYRPLFPTPDWQNTSAKVIWYIQINNETPIPFTAVDFLDGLNQEWTEYTYNQTLTLEASSEIRIYGDIEQNAIDSLDYLILWGENGLQNCSGVHLFDKLGSDTTHFYVTADTIYPETNAEGFLIHDVAGQITDRIISQNSTFYSEYLGSSITGYRQYVDNGCAWIYMILKGLQVRQYSLLEKPFFMSFNKFWDGANPILNLGLGYEDVAGVEVIRIEEKEHFYDPTILVYFDNVRDITKSYDNDVIFKTVKHGYKTWKADEVLGLDDSQTKHVRATSIKKSGVDVNLESEFIAASVAIESTRRTTRIKSADHKFDDDAFIIAINPTPTEVTTSPDVVDFVPELDENFTSITGLINADTRYNSRITPVRNFFRWLNYLSGCLQPYLSTVFKFVSAEGNYDMESEMELENCPGDNDGNPITEKQDISPTNEYLHLSMLYEINIPLEWDDYVLIRDNRKNAIGVSQTNTGHTTFFIKEMEYRPIRGTATIRAWPLTYMPINVIESSFPIRTCEPVVECENAYLTEGGDEFNTEDGQCLILN